MEKLDNAEVDRHYEQRDDHEDVQTIEQILETKASNGSDELDSVQDTAGEELWTWECGNSNFQLWSTEGKDWRQMNRKSKHCEKTKTKNKNKSSGNARRDTQK